MTTPKARFEIVADDKTAAAFKSALGNANKFGSQLSGLLKASFAGLSLGAITGAINKAIQYGDELGKLSAKSGLSTAAAAELSYAFQQNDLDMNMLSTSMKKMQTEISKGNDIFKQLGISLDDLKAQAPDRQFETLAQRISELRDPADRTRAAVEAFGRAGADLLPLFEQGAAGIRAAREEAVRLGHTMSEEAVKSLQEGDKAIKQMEASWGSFTRKLAVWTAEFGQVLDVVDKDLFGELEDQLRRLNAEKRQLETGNEGGLFDKQRWADLNQSIEETKARLENARIAQMLKEVGSSSGHGAINSSGGIGKLEDDGKEAKAIDEIRITATKIKTGPDIEQWANDQLDAINKTNEAWEELKLSVPEAADTMATDAIGDLEKMNEALKKSADDTNVYMEQMHDSLYRSFHDLFMDIGTGADNFAQSLLNTFKSLLADMATKELFEALGNLGTTNSGSWWGNVLSGLFTASAKGNAFGRSGLLTAFASGGVVSGATPFAYAGGLGVMGEAGEEAIMPLSRGSDGKLGVKAQSGGGTTTIAPVINIDARGTTEDAVKLLPQVARSASDDAVARILDMKRRGKF